MKRYLPLIHLALLLTISLALLSFPATAGPPSSPARAIDAIVSTQWLEDNMDQENLVLLDVRMPEQYAGGHIPGSANVPAIGNFFLCIMDPDCGLWMELPPDDALFTTIGNAGITASSVVVVIPTAIDMPPLAPAEFGITLGARVAITLLYAGVENVAMLDGGYTKWALEDRATSTEPVTPTAVAFNGMADKAMFVSKDYVEDRMGKSTLVDTREADTFFGVEPDPSSSRAGHIPASKVLPAPWFWAKETDEAGETTYMMWKDPAKISEIALAVLGEDSEEEIIIYCGVGGYASPVYYALTEMVGYTNVKFYDGSMQEWTADPEAPVVIYQWE
jgi:thiosulfate/3-mercaptopyruvate sulfurtransferase